MPARTAHVTVSRAMLGLFALGLVGFGVPCSGHAQQPRDLAPAMRESLGKGHGDHWGLKQIGFTPTGAGLATRPLAVDARHPVIVAVIDSGLDYAHLDLRPENLWRNPAETANGRDDDANGYVDDLIGWNFVDRTNDPRDHVGHGTHVAGIVVGINPRVTIMPLKILNVIGRGHATGLAEAIFYAVKHKARIINLSVGGQGISRTERLAIEYAHREGVLVVVAAGNASADTLGFGPAGIAGALAVAATDGDDKRVGFSNWGEAVKIAAPGVDIVSLRATDTDVNHAMGIKDYVAGSAFVGPGARYYRTSGTSFAAPFVTGVASLLLSRNPQLTSAQIERMLVMSADDVAPPGWDQYTGSGRLNAVKALRADPDWYLLAQVKAIKPTREGSETVIHVHGTAVGSTFKSYTLEVGQGETPPRWNQVGTERAAPVADGLLGTISRREITAPGRWTIRVLAKDTAGTQREARGTLTVR